MVSLLWTWENAEITATGVCGRGEWERLLMAARRQRQSIRNQGQDRNPYMTSAPHEPIIPQSPTSEH